MNYMQDIARPLTEAGIVDPKTIKGCTQQEVATLMDAQHVSHLPKRYREFLLFGGRDPYWLNRGGEWDYSWLLEAKEIARETVVDDYHEDFTPFADAFVFQTHQGYMFHYFRSEDLEEPDPHFWIYTGNRPLRQSTRDFTGWIRTLAQEIPEAVELRKRIHGRADG
ncbi:SMI1/KNR4 family protein [Nocardia asteroides]|nr:SMI1/KNR4 family protein [Nocardia asteroides]UGT53431.1 SMI1/KNR4 family protein [Nocardia asteroides]